jgi:hypothetical protein
VEVRLDSTKSARFSGSMPSNDRLAASILAADTIYDCPNPPKERSWPRNRRESGECRLCSGGFSVFTVGGHRRPRLYREMTLSPVFSSCIKHHHGCSNMLGDSRAKWISITMVN